MMKSIELSKSLDNLDFELNVAQAPMVVSQFENKKPVHRVEQKNTKMFMELSQLGKSSNKAKRFSQFVICTGAPDLPRTHPGVDDSYNVNRDIDAEWLDLLERGHTTLKYIAAQKNAHVCDQMVFLRGPITSEDDVLTKKIHSQHTLDTYRDQIIKEKQLPIEFHFAGHCNGEKIGALTVDTRLEPSDFVALVDQIFGLSGLQDTLKSKPELVFEFHVCNGAYVDIKQDATDDEIKSAVFNDSFIGKFYQEMLSLGYNNIEVKGYRGFYQGMSNGSGIRVTNATHHPSEEFDGRKVIHSIKHVKVNNRYVHQITTPERKYATWDIDMNLGNRVRNNQQ